MDVEEHNFQQIEMLNQRGGRTLSIVDLIRAGTISAEMAGCAMRAMQQGASLLTGARPSGAGKTTLMAAMLHLLPPDVPIVTVERPAVIAEAQTHRPARRACYLAHEIGAGRYFGYIWGRNVAEFLNLVDGPRRVATCLHADTLEETEEILAAPPLSAGRDILEKIGLVLFMRIDRTAGGYRRRVTTMYGLDGDGKRRRWFAHQADSDTFERVDAGRETNTSARHVDFMRRLVDLGESDVRAVRRRVLEFYAHD
jgi:hypothetical protein